MRNIQQRDTCKLVALSLALALSFTPTLFAVDVVTDPVGFITLIAKGHGGVASSQFSFLGLGMTQLVLAQGKVTSFAASTITDANASWSNDQFNGANGPHFVEITSGPNAGTIDHIVDTDGATKTITTQNNLSSLLSGNETYRVRKHWTIASVFGPSNQVGLAGSSSAALADNILVSNGSSFDIYYYKTTVIPGGIGWRHTTNTSADASGTILYLDQGVIVRRRQVSDVAFKLVGGVKLGQTISPVETGNSFLGNVYAANLTLGGSGLYTGSGTTGLVGSNSAAVADNVLVYNGSTYDTYYYKTTLIPGGIGWRHSTNTSADASSTPIPVGSSVVIQRKAGRPPFDWASPPPY